MRVRIEPPMDRWRIAASRGGGAPLIATGHQAWLWHPGILAKDIAMSVAAERLGTRALHLVVDHDVHESLQVSFPVREGDRLVVKSVRLGESKAHVPTGCQPPVDRGEMLRRLDEASRTRGLAVDVGALRAAVKKLGDGSRSLAEQMAELTATLMRPSMGTSCEVPFAYSSRLLQQIDAQAIVERMLTDARRCVRAYNTAVAERAGAGVAVLLEERDRVELPLWQLAWGRERRRVFADLADDSAILTYEDGTPIEPDERWLAPRALLLTAVMRATMCDFFIHGTGGGAYDAVMERWWELWTGSRPRAGMAVVSADVYLPLGAPVADAGDLARATWFRHHLPHNVDRVVPAASANGALAARKRALLQRLGGGGDRWQRREAFRELHHINDELLRRHPDVLREAEGAIERARVGVGNAVIARKRDWCFALYPPDRLAALRREIESACAVAGGGRVQSSP